MKKIVLFIIMFLFFISCSEKKKEYFEGYVYYKNKPLENVIITEGCPKPDDIFSKTDSLGYFRLKRFSMTSAHKLTFSKKGFKTDTVRLLRGRNYPPIYHLFLREQTDTLFMKKIK